jgi:hypothetical protein
VELHSVLNCCLIVSVVLGSYVAFGTFGTDVLTFGTDVLTFGTDVLTFGTDVLTFGTDVLALRRFRMYSHCVVKQILLLAWSLRLSP